MVYIPIRTWPKMAAELSDVNEMISYLKIYAGLASLNKSEDELRKLPESQLMEICRGVFLDQPTDQSIERGMEITDLVNALSKEIHEEMMGDSSSGGDLLDPLILVSELEIGRKHKEKG